LPLSLPMLATSTPAGCSFAYKLIEERPTIRLLWVAPSHRALFRGLPIYDRGRLSDTLGVIPADTELSKKMMEKWKEIQFLPEAQCSGTFLGGSASISSSGHEILQLVPIVMNLIGPGRVVEILHGPLRRPSGEKGLTGRQHGPLSLPLLRKAVEWTDCFRPHRSV